MRGCASIGGAALQRRTDDTAANAAIAAILLGYSTDDVCRVVAEWCARTREAPSPAPSRVPLRAHGARCNRGAADVVGPVGLTWEDDGAQD